MKALEGLGPIIAGLVRWANDGRRGPSPRPYSRLQ